ncbi:hypothetical protein SMIPMB4A_v3c5200 [Spiroplasma melliferum IPMB4A]|uniref:Uncharacterized protein n=3 Tax=Spiroplasma melliferum TaxID=2134 RepID=A0AAI9X1F4_SPIME|nr:hypothetical protein [Spiroplasma melliferum]ELL44536.1 hypothetical protein SMIPMB4A_v3c5200 [Spiroplasma melliferum IPMB4A]KAI93187.1 hypothetical protein SPM_003810 [Spiroplasma melliferum KC3]QCO23988.1 hypothetical protein SRED_002468 [Spiroplasma melliferum]
MLIAIINVGSFLINAYFISQDNQENVTNNVKQEGRVKRSFNDNQDEIETSSESIFTSTKFLYASFRPALWTQIIIYRTIVQTKEEFINFFVAEMFSKTRNVCIDWGIKRLKYMESFANLVWNNWNKIDAVWNNSNKKQRIRIVAKVSPDIIVGEVYNKKIEKRILSEYISTNIRDDEDEMNR